MINTKTRVVVLGEGRLWLGKGTQGDLNSNIITSNILYK